MAVAIVLPLLILSLIAALLRADFFFAVAYLFGGAYILSRLWTQYTIRRLRVRRQFAHRAFPGNQVTVELSVYNASWLPIPWLEIHESLPVQLTTPPFHRQVISIGPRQQSRLSYTLQCRQRGYYPIGPLVLQTGDMLGIRGRQDQTQIAADPIIIYPQVVPLQKLGLPTRSPLAALPTSAHLFEDPARVMGVRDYRRGDSPRRIHWTATASAGRLLVKQYQPSLARETLICLDLAEENYEQRRRYTATELAIIVAASIAHHIIVSERLPVGLTTEAHDPLVNARACFYLPPRPERAHLMSILEVLARVKVTGGASFADLLRRQSVRLPWGATVAIITGREDEGLRDTLAYLRRAGFALALILVQPTQPSPALEECAKMLHIPVHRIWQEHDLEAWR